MDCLGFRRLLENRLDELWYDEKQDHDPSMSEKVGDLTLSDAMARHASECPDCRIRWDAARSLVEARQFRPAAPAGLDARIMDRLRGERIRPLFASRIGVPALAAAAALVMILVFAVPWSRPERGAMLVRFQLEAPDASRVYVVGDWNNWSPAADPLEDSDGDGRWEAVIYLNPGYEYRYQFFIDERQWVADPGAPLKVYDDFGGWSSILQL